MDKIKYQLYLLSNTNKIILHMAFNNKFSEELTTCNFTLERKIDKT